MTGLLHEKEFSRKSFVKGGGALIVSLSALSAVANAATPVTPFNQRTAADFQNTGDPRQTQVDTFIAVTADNKVIVAHGETELGHGTPTGILMIVAEEMNVTMDQMVYDHVESWLNSVGGGSGSSGISSRSTGIRAAAAYAKTTLLNMASANLGVPVASLSVAGGVVSGGGKSVTYGSLIAGKLFSTTMVQGTATPGQAGDANVKAVANYTLVGRSFPRIDIPAKVNGSYTYVHNVHIPGMIHGRRVRPRGAGANTSQNHFPVSVDATSIAHIPGAQVVQINNWLGVVAPKEYDAIQAAAQLKVVWKSDPKFNAGGSADYWSWLRTAGDTNTVTPAKYSTLLNATNVPATMAGAAKTVSATYHYNYNGFMPIGPHCAVADVTSTGATVYVQAQAINGYPASLATLLGKLPTPIVLTPGQVRVIWYEGASSFGGGQTQEVNEEALILSATVGKPVRVQWMRWDQHGWDHWGQAHMADVTMGADANGNIIASDWTSYGQAQSNSDTTQELLGTFTWPATPGGNGFSMTDQIYKFVADSSGTKRVLSKSQPLYGGAVRCNFLRAPAAPQTYFMSEQIVDELAHAMNMDPIAFRRQNIDGTQTLGARWLAVMDAATIAAGWKSKVAASNLQSGNVVTGRGFGFGTYASSQVGIVADVQVNKKTGRFNATHLTVAQNNGVTIGPQLVGNQMSGAMIMGLSRAMLEGLSWNQDRITSLDWVSYPILRFKDVPSVTLVNVHPGEYVTIVPGDMTTASTPGTDVSVGNTNSVPNGWTLTGSGEPPISAISSAMANAFFDATGARIRQSPMNYSTVRDTLKNAGVV